MESSSRARKPLRSVLAAALLAGTISATTLGAAVPAHAEFCSGYVDPETGHQDCWYDDEYELMNSPYYYLPTMKGTMAVGATLAAEAIPNNFPWTVLTYKWLRNSTPIDGATTASYKLTDADIGKTMGLEVYGEAIRYYPAGDTFTAETTVKGYALTAGAPVVSGTGRVGSALSVTPGIWTAGTTFSYRWLRNGTPIVGASAASYRLTEADRGTRIAVRVTGSKPLYDSTTKSVLGAGVVAESATAVLNGRLPTLTGTPAVGSILKATPGTWSQPALTYRYQWLRDRSIPIPGATGSSYKVTAADLAFRSLTVKIYAVKRGWTTGTALSGPVGRIMATR